MIGDSGVIGGGSALLRSPECSRASVQIPGKGSAIAADRLRYWAQQFPELGVLIWRHERRILAQSIKSAACHGTHQLSGRLCTTLLMMRDVSGLATLPVTQEALAELLAVQRTSVSHVAHSLHQSGAIRVCRGRIKILNEEALRNDACDCYAASPYACVSNDFDVQNHFQVTPHHSRIAPLPI
jgi:CRP-like cAMP-binding protein